MGVWARIFNELSPDGQTDGQTQAMTIPLQPERPWGKNEGVETLMKMKSFQESPWAMSQIMDHAANNFINIPVWPHGGSMTVISANTTYTLHAECQPRVKQGNPRHDEFILGNRKVHFLFESWCHQMETFSALLAICAGNSPVPVNSLHKGQWRGALMFSLICAWINGWVNNCKAGDLKRYCAHYDVIVMSYLNTEMEKVAHIHPSQRQWPVYGASLISLLEF